MIVERNFYNVKFGCLKDIIELCKESSPWWDQRNITTRMYDSIFAPYSVLCIETEYESFAQYEKITEEWAASQEWAAIAERWASLCDRGGYGEAWTLVT